MTNKINNIKSYISFSLVQNKVLSKECYLLTNLNNITVILYG